MPWNSRRHPLVVCLAVALQCGFSSRADAKDYFVYSCRTPDGLTAPGIGGRYGWQTENSGPPVMVADGCAARTGLEIKLANAIEYRPGDFGRWQFMAPPGTLISAWTILWLGRSSLGRDGQPGNNAGRADLRVTRADGAVEPIAQREASVHPPETFSQQGVALQAITSEASCEVTKPGDPICVTDPGNRDNPLAQASVLSAKVTLNDASAPGGGVSGPPAENAAWIGPQQLTYNAADRGGGVYRVILEVDGVPRAQTLADANGGTCRDAIPDNEADHEFFSATPCLNETSGTLAFDTAALPEGERTVRVLVEDAAGNQSVIYGPTTKTIVKDLAARGFYFGGQWFNPSLSAPRQLNGAGASEGARMSASFVTTSGSRKDRRRTESTAKEVGFRTPARIRGRLVNVGGQPIANAVVHRAVQEARGEWRLDGEAKTAPDGTFTLLTERQRPSRTLKFVYFPFSDSHAHSVSNELELRVRAGAQLRATPRKLRNGQKVRFLGRVFGTLPPGGVTAALQVKNGSRYQTFRQLRIDPAKGGVVRTAYRFRATNATTRYRFRLLIVRQAGLVYERGASPAVSVVVRR